MNGALLLIASGPEGSGALRNSGDTLTHTLPLVFVIETNPHALCDVPAAIAITSFINLRCVDFLAFDSSGIVVQIQNTSCGPHRL